MTGPLSRSGALWLALALALAAPAALAQGQPALTPEQRAMLRQVAEQCRADVARYCGDVPRGQGRVLICLDQKAGALSPGCRVQLGNAATMLAQMRAAYGG